MSLHRLLISTRGRWKLEKKQVGSYAVKNHHFCSAVLCPYMATAKNNQSITLNNSNWWTSYSSPVSIIKGCFEFRSAFSCGNDQSAFQRHYIIEQQALSLFTHFFSDVCLVSCPFTQQWHIQQRMSVVYDPPLTLTWDGQRQRSSPVSWTRLLSSLCSFSPSSINNLSHVGV